MAPDDGRPACIVHWREVQEPDEWRYPHDSLPDRLRGKR